MTDAGVCELIDLDLSLDWSPACEWGGLREAGISVSEPGCDNAAEWIGTSLCCRLVRFYCGGHRAERVAFIASHPRAVHKSCGAPGAPMVWAPLEGHGHG